MVTGPIEAKVSAEQPPDGSGISFEEFFGRSYERLLRAMYLLTGDRNEAEELAQEAFFRTYERWDRVQSTSNPAGYVYRVALNAYRSRLRRLAVSMRRAVVTATPSDVIEASDERDAIRRALVKLPAGQKAALVLLDWVGLTDQEAGQLLGISAEAVRMRASRARTRLRGDLTHGGGDRDD